MTVDGILLAVPSREEESLVVVVFEVDDVDEGDDANR